MTTTIRFAAAAMLGLSLAGCMGDMATNRSLESLHQPVVERASYALDLTASPSGVSGAEQKRLADWFDAMDLRYGDRISVEDPLRNPSSRADLTALVGRYGLTLSEDAPVTANYVNAGSLRVVVTRSKAAVPSCPDWQTKSDGNLRNATASNYGCAINSNLAAMIADPEHLLQGAGGRGDADEVAANEKTAKAIGTYRTATPTGAGGLKQTSSTGK